MATVYSDAYALDQVQDAYIPTSAGLDQQGTAKIQYFTITSPATLAASDVIQVCPIPDGARVTRLIVKNTDLDGNASPTLAHKIGYKSVDDAFGSSLTALQAAATTTISDTVLLAAAAATAGDDLRITVTTVAATQAAGTINVLVEYAYV